MSIDAATQVILRELLSDFRQRQLGASELEAEYQGVAVNTLQQTSSSTGVNKVDFDLALKQLEEDELVGTGPQALTEPVNTPEIFIFPMPYSKREYAYLKEKGYKAASKSVSVSRGKPASTIIHGGQFNNYGQSGAMGQQAFETVNFQHQWNQVGSDADLALLVGELERLRSELQKRASSRDELRQAATIADAEEQAEQQDGSKLMQTLSKVGKGALDVAKEIGVDLAAKVIAKATGLEP